MYYWRDQSFKDLKEVANSQEAKVEFPLYGLYCEQREKGLRKLSFETLTAFISEGQKWPDEKKFCFVSWIYSVGYGKSFINDLIPHQLYDRFIKPVLNHWNQKEPSNSEPLRLMNTFDSLRQALVVNPDDDIAAEYFIKKSIARLDNSTHELPYHGYLGDLGEELNLLNECLQIVDRSKSARVVGFKDKLQSLVNLLNSWKDFKEVKISESFRDWAIRNKRIYEIK